MSFWAIVPVKPFRTGKSRLAGVLSLDERQTLNRCLLRNTLDRLSNTSGLDQILVISRDAMALDLAAKMGAFPVQEISPSNLNLALEKATRMAQEAGPHGVLILPADLPLLTSADIRAILRCAGEPPAIVIVPDRHHLGTNALLVNPAGIIKYQFGPGSFQRHCDSSRRIGVQPVVCDSPSIALDIDFPEDLEMVKDGVTSLLSMINGGHYV